MRSKEIEWFGNETVTYKTFLDLLFLRHKYRRCSYDAPDEDQLSSSSPGRDL